MYIRCPRCGHSTRVGLGTLERGVRCGSCAEHHALKEAGRLGNTPSERSRRAEEFARSEGIDLASAYSVLLGLFTLEDARSYAQLFPDEPTQDESDPGAVGPMGHARGIGYDRGFEPAVAERLLTPQEAARRGDRVAYASRLAAKHGLPIEVAFLVADNRLTVTAARKQVSRESSPAAAATPEEQAATSAEPAQSEPTARPLFRQLAGPATALVALTVLTLWWARRDGGTGAASLDGSPLPARLPLRAAVARVQASSEIRKDTAGRPTQVKGLEPGEVLDAFCRADDRAARRPVKVMPGGPGWLGLFREEGRLEAIVIEKDPRSGGWLAGNGLEPIVPIDASELRETALSTTR